MVFKHTVGLLKHGSLWSYRIATWAVLVAGAALLLSVLALRYVLLPHVDAARPTIARMASSAIKLPVEIEKLEGSWRGYRPELTLHGFRIAGPDGQPALALKRVDGVLSWLALLSGKLRFHSIALQGVSLDVRRDAEGIIWVGGNAMRPQAGERHGGFGEWILAQKHVLIREGTLTWSDERLSAPPLVVGNVTLRLDNDGASHRFALNGKPEQAIASVVDLRGVISVPPHERPIDGAGQIYCALADVDLARVQTWFPVKDVQIGSGRGSLRLWLQVNEGRVLNATADASLEELQAQLAPEAPALALSQFAGRLHWKQRGRGVDLRGERISFVTAQGIALPPADLALQTDGTRNELTLRGLELSPVTALIEHLPVAAHVRERLATVSPSGRIESARLEWESPWRPSGPWSAEGKLRNVQWSPDGVLPGVKGFYGALTASERGGTMSMRVESGALALPRVFEESIPIDFLSGEVDWVSTDSDLQVSIRAAAFTNQHAAGEVSGTYSRRPGETGNADFTAALLRADAASVWRYIPRTAPNTQAWLKRALRAGSARDVRVRLKGPLQRFPFRDGKTGQFEVTSRVQDVTLAFDEQWPALERINGRVRFHGAEMDVEADSGTTGRIPLGRAHVRIPELGNKDETLMVEGEASAAPADFLAYLGATPLRKTAAAVENMRANGGAGNLRLSMQLPLRRIADSEVDGRLELSADRFSVIPRLPELTAVSAAVEFTEEGVTVKNGKARVYDTPLAFDVANSRGKGTSIQLAGRADAAALLKAFRSPLVESIEGATDWSASVQLLEGRMSVRANASLAGMALNVPAPLAKPATDSLPLAIEVIEEQGRPTQVSARLGAVTTAKLALDDGELKAGEIRLGGEAGLPTRPGLAIVGHIQDLDVDKWQQWANQGKSGSGSGVQRLDLTTGALRWAGRRYTGLRLRGEQSDGLWQVSLDAPDVVGRLSWGSQSGGRLAGRFTRLFLPAPEPAVQAASPGSGLAAQSLPALDIVVEDFRFEGKPLGRLELQAVPRERIWQLDRLYVSNPDGRLEAQGKWVLGERSSTELNLRLQAEDIGKLLLRLGYPEGIKGGKGFLAGPITWAGPPYRPDFGSMGGQLRLEAQNGRFARLEPGVGKLLGILSLQALPRRLSLDFRDVFSSGFSFDSIDADVMLDDGVARTDNFRMEGPAARVAMQGKVDLAAETQDLRLRILPQLSTGVAIAGAVVNPAIGIATLLAQKALGDPVEQLAALEYQVGGTWSEPKIASTTEHTDSVSGRR